LQGLKTSIFLMSAIWCENQIQ